MWWELGDGAFAAVARGGEWRPARPCAAPQAGGCMGTLGGDIISSPRPDGHRIIES